MQQIGLFSVEGLVFFTRWMHFFAGVIWIGLLYYFNFVQGAFMNEVDAPVKSQMQQKMFPRALGWFRYGALFTFLTGIIILSIRGHQMGHAIWGSAWGIAILTGALFGTLMFLNVWLVIWPNQKVIIENAKTVASGGQANPNVAACATRALVASRTNTMFSLPMLFFMGAASHLPIYVGENSKMAYWAALFVVVGLLQVNALKGKTGPMTSVVGVIHCGLALAAVVYALMVALV